MTLVSSACSFVEAIEIIGANTFSEGAHQKPLDFKMVVCIL